VLQYLILGLTRTGWHPQQAQPRASAQPARCRAPRAQRGNAAFRSPGNRLLLGPDGFEGRDPQYPEEGWQGPGHALHHWW